MDGASLPWRGPGPGRPDLPLPPSRMPLRSAGQNRKRWRYVGFFGENLMLCAARAQVGPLSQSFWVMWDREGRRPADHTALRPGSREVRLDGPNLEIDARGLRASLRLGECAPIESICPSGSGWGWTRKRAGMPIEGTVEIEGRRRQVSGFGVDDESAGYHQRRTSWRWSAGVGHAVDGRPLAWNLVEGVNDPPANSERTIWLDGAPSEPAPVRFDGVAAIEFTDQSRLDFASESAHARDDNYLLFRSRYRHNFGSFSGSLAGIELGDGLGVMEEHDAIW
ncbi:MAG: hypothetical protein QOE56_2701 [Solirubrobacterales bacterium]|nr:hypothetical protein [Solirubrobacterales bacterium]